MDYLLIHFWQLFITLSPLREIRLGREWLVMFCHEVDCLMMIGLLALIAGCILNTGKSYICNITAYETKENTY
jgi:hypothetical protein